MTPLQAKVLALHTHARQKHKNEGADCKMCKVNIEWFGSLSLKELDMALEEPGSAFPLRVSVADRIADNLWNNRQYRPLPASVAAYLQQAKDRQSGVIKGGR